MTKATGVWCLNEWVDVGSYVHGEGAAALVQLQALSFPQCNGHACKLSGVRLLLVKGSHTIRGDAFCFTVMLLILITTVSYGAQFSAHGR